MKRRSIALIASAGVAAIGLLVWSQAQAPTPPLAEYVPAGPLLYLEARDFAGLLKDWDQSTVKQTWLKSANYQVFSRSRLLLRLGQARDEFAEAAGVPPNYALAQSVAGDASALAIYDIGNLEFLYLTRMPSAKIAESALWKVRGDYQTRNVAGLTYYVKEDGTSHRVAAFASAKDYLVLATREDLIAGALTMIAGQSRPSIRQEAWFGGALAAAGAGNLDLRLVMNFDRLVRSPHFRSYWVQRNASEVKQFSAGIADLQRTPAEIRENRALLRATESPNLTGQEPAIAEVLRLVPAEAGLYRAWAVPATDQAVELIRQKLLWAGVEQFRNKRFAPVVPSGDETVGSAQDLEMRIDEPPLADDKGKVELDSLRKLITDVKPSAMLQVEATRPIPGGVFVGVQSAIVLLAPGDWRIEAARDALTPAVENLWTTSRLGAGWREQKAGAQTFYQMDGLAQLTMATNGRLLILSSTPEWMNVMLSRLGTRAGSQGATYAAGYRHGRELADFQRMMRLIDYPLGGSPLAGSAQEPPFFSENLASLGRTLATVTSASIVVHDDGKMMKQTVVYQLR